MVSDTRYTIFRTRWGHFGFACIGDALCRTLLPVPSPNDARQGLDIDGNATFEKNLLPDLQRQIKAYYEGQEVDFRTTPPLALPGRTAFATAVLNACRQIGFGQTETYTSLAEKIGRPGAARAVGTALAQNPIPLVIPCHRVIRSDGGLGGFSAVGGTTVKQRMLRHENPA